MAPRQLHRPVCLALLPGLRRRETRNPPAWQPHSLVWQPHALPLGPRLNWFDSELWRAPASSLVGRPTVHVGSCWVLATGVQCSPLILPLGFVPTPWQSSYMAFAGDTCSEQACCSHTTPRETHGLCIEFPIGPPTPTHKRTSITRSFGFVSCTSLALHADMYQTSSGEHDGFGVSICNITTLQARPYVLTGKLLKSHGDSPEVFLVDHSVFF